jgi:hypothetical protein
MNSYINEIMDILPGETPKEKYESVLKMNMEIGTLKGRIYFLKSQFEWINESLSQNVEIPKTSIETILKQL